MADPLGRLAVDPATVVATYDVVKYQRVESRAVSLLLASLPATLKEDIVVNRWLTTASILFRILCTYQPGGSSERAHLLGQLVTPDVCKSFPDAVRILRRLDSVSPEGGGDSCHTHRMPRCCFGG